MCNDTTTKFHVFKRILDLMYSIWPGWPWGQAALSFPGTGYLLAAGKLQPVWILLLASALTKPSQNIKAGPAIFSPVVLHPPRHGMSPRPRQAGLHRSLWHQIPHYSPPARLLHAPAPPPLPRVLHILFSRPISPLLSNAQDKHHAVTT